LVIRCLLVLDNDSLLKFALETVLWPARGITTTLSTASDNQTLTDEIRRCKAQIVIIDGAGKMAGTVSVAHLMLNHPALQIIVLRQDSNSVHVFRSDEMEIKKSIDILNIIKTSQLQ
jgi:hypothetical protein